MVDLTPSERSVLADLASRQPPEPDFGVDVWSLTATPPYSIEGTRRAMRALFAHGYVAETRFGWRSRKGKTKHWRVTDSGLAYLHANAAQK